MNYGYVKVAAAVPNIKVADCTHNVQQIKSLIVEAEKENVQVVSFPELCVTGYSCGDLFNQETLLRQAEKALCELAEFTREMSPIVIVGLPIRYRSQLFNAAAVLYKGEIHGIVPKMYLPNYGEFYEMRWFSQGKDLAMEHPHHITHLRWKCGSEDIPFSPRLVFQTPEFNFGVEICEDVWSVTPPGSNHCLAGADIVFNLSASNEVIGKHNYLRSLLAQQSARCLCGYVYASCGQGESTTDVVFGGSSFIHENGHLLAEGERFSMTPKLTVAEIDVEALRNERLRNKSFAAASVDVRELEFYREVEIEVEKKQTNLFLTRPIDPMPFVPKGEQLEEHCNEAFTIQVAGLCQRLQHTHAKAAVVGISGGLDSTLALLVCVKAFDRLGRSRKDILGVTMPGFGTTDRTYRNAIDLMKSLGVTIREVSIKEACLQHFSDIGHNPSVHDVTYENSQARERTQILMDIANQLGGMVVGTGDLSELALGWATYNGDHMSMYGVNGGVPKTLIKSLVAWIADNHVDADSAETLHDIIDTPISPELIPADEQGNIKQKTEDLVGPYELHDFFLFHFIRHGFRPKKIFYLATLAFAGKYEHTVIKHWLTTFFRRFFNQQFKRSCLPDGPKVGSVSLSPRGDWRMPSDADSAEWLRECERL